MVRINNVQIKHNGIMADKGTKVTLFLPELLDQQHLDLINLIKEQTVGIILFRPEEMEQITQVLHEASMIAEISTEELEREAPAENKLPDLELGDFISEENDF